jgi:hypothetical protein
VALARRRVGAALTEPEPVLDLVVHRDAAEGASAAGSSVRGVSARDVDSGLATPKLAEQALVAAGFTVTRRNQRVRGTGVTVSFAVTDADDTAWYFDLAGANTTHRGGLVRNDVVWRALGRAVALRGASDHIPVVLLTAQLPRRSSDADAALRAGGPGTVFDVIDLLNPSACERLERYAKGGFIDNPQPGFWTAAELAISAHRTP